MAEERRFGARFTRFPKIAQADTDKSEEAASAQIDTLSQGKSDLGQFLAGRRRNGRSMASGMNVELTCLELEHDCPGDARFLARSEPDLLR